MDLAVEQNFRDFPADINYIMCKFTENNKYQELTGIPKSFLKVNREICGFDYVLLSEKDAVTNVCLVSNQILPKVSGCDLEFSLVHNLDAVKDCLADFLHGEMNGKEFGNTFIVFFTERKEIEIYQVNPMKF